MITTKYIVKYVIGEIKKDWGSTFNHPEIEYYDDQQTAFTRYVYLLRKASLLGIVKINLHKETTETELLAQQNIEY